MAPGTSGGGGRVSGSKNAPIPVRLAALNLQSHGGTDDRICWRFTHLDKDGPWGLAPLDHDRVLGLLAAMATF
ncbi:hypothetical protein KBZ21_42055, partial [Streptomyces sp. A73]|nr:hypothetical protein [Streptomyces sp. A73]